MQLFAMLIQSAIALAALVLLTAGPSYAQPLRSTSIPSSLADDEKRLMPEVMNEFYGSFDKEKACWISKHEDTENMKRTYCMKPIRLDVIKSSRSKNAFHCCWRTATKRRGPAFGVSCSAGVLGLIVLTPNGANLGVVATNLYGPYEFGTIS